MIEPQRNLPMDQEFVFVSEPKARRVCIVVSLIRIVDRVDLFSEAHRSGEFTVRNPHASVGRKTGGRGRGVK